MGQFSDGLEPHVFSVRLWAQDVGGDSVEWRGRVRDLESGEARYFRDWETLLAFLRTRLTSSGDLLSDIDRVETQPKGSEHCA